MRVGAGVGLTAWLRSGGRRCSRAGTRSCSERAPGSCTEREAAEGQARGQSNAAPGTPSASLSLPSPLQLAALDGAQQQLLFLGGGTGVIGGQEAGGRDGVLEFLKLDKSGQLAHSEW